MYNQAMANSATTGLALSGNTNVPLPDVSAVSRQTTLIQKLLAEHREVQGVVEQRLHSVLNPNAPTTSGTGGAQQSASSPLVADLDGFATALQQLLTGYQSILNRLDL